MNCEACGWEPATCSFHLADSLSAANVIFVCFDCAASGVEALIGDGESVEVIHGAPA